MVKREDVKVGDYLVNNDPRKPGQAKKIIGIYQIGEDWYAMYQAGYRTARVRFDRIFLSGGERPPRNGWTLAGSNP